MSFAAEFDKATARANAILVDMTAEPAPTMTVQEAAELLGISPDHAYRLIKADDFPVPILRLGRTIRIPRRPLLAALGITDDPGQSSPPTLGEPRIEISHIQNDGIHLGNIDPAS